MRPITPLPGFNVAVAPRSRYCGNHVGGKVLATEQFGARGYCYSYAFELRAYSRSKPCADESNAEIESLRRVDAVARLAVSI